MAKSWRREEGGEGAKKKDASLENVLLLALLMQCRTTGRVHNETLQNR